jgi:hypothetical protein
MARSTVSVRTLVPALALFAAGSHGAARGPAEPPQKPDRKVAEMMRKKLEHAQKVLEGVALGDFDVIGKNAKALRQISERAEWRVFPTPAYLLHSNEFQRAADRLAQDAADKNLDGAALSYVGLTLTCVKCHKYVREQRMTWRGVGGRQFARG